MSHSRTYAFSSSIQHTHSPSRGRRTTVIDHSPQRMVTTSRALGGDIHSSTMIHHAAPAPAYPRGRANHHVNPMTDSIVSYGVDENGEEIKITSTGILRNPELRTVAEKTSPGRKMISNTMMSTAYGAPLMSSTNIHEMSPTRQVKETVFRPSPQRTYGVSHRVTGYSPVRHTTTFSPSVTQQYPTQYSPNRSQVVTRHYTNAPAPVVTHAISHSSSVRSSSMVSVSASPSPVRHYTRTQFSPTRHTVTRTQLSPARRAPALVTSTYSRSPSPVRHTVTRTNFSPVRRAPAMVTSTYSRSPSPVRHTVTRTNFSPVNRTVTRTNFSPSRRTGLITSTYSRSPARVMPAPQTRTHVMTRNYSPARSMSSSVSVVSHSASPVRHHTTTIRTSNLSPSRVMTRTEVFSPTRSPSRPITTQNYDGRGGTLVTESIPFGGTMVHKTQGVENVSSRVDRMLAQSRAMRTPMKRSYSKTIVERSTAGSINHSHTHVVF